MNVPDAVPSERQSSLPWTWSSALKNSVPLTAVRLRIFALNEPGAVSATKLVPSGVPSVRQSSSPCSWSNIVK